MIRFGVDFGGTKIEVAALNAAGDFVARVRKFNSGNYDEALEVVAALVADAELMAGGSCVRLGLGISGLILFCIGLICNANSIYLNGCSFGENLETRLVRSVWIVNDANCLALFEAADGVGAGASVVFVVIVGIGCGGGVVVDGKIINGHNGIGGEWGYVSLFWFKFEEYLGSDCWCGCKGCLETWIVGPAFVCDVGFVNG